MRLNRIKTLPSFSNCLRRKETLLIYIADIRRLDNNRQQILTGMCKIWWSQRDLAYEYFYLALPFIVEALETINGTHAEMGSFALKYTEGWDYIAKREPTSMLNAVTSFKFIISRIALYRLLHPLAGTNNHLQGFSVNIIEAYL